MGVFIWNEWGGLVAQASAAYVIWGGLFGIFYRKYFWDMIGATLGPHGLIPPPEAKFFMTIIVDLPILQILNMVNGLITLIFEWPLPYVKDTALHRSFITRVIFYTFCAVVAFLPYQTFDGGAFYVIATLAYLQAVSKGEMMPAAKAKRGTVGSA